MTQQRDATASWKPTTTWAALQARANLVRQIRSYFEERGVLEVDTPILSNAALPDYQVEYFTTRYVGPGAAHGRTMYLHTSPEIAMKRLLAAGSGCIYQICKVFRNGESGAMHNPEFTMLEWYRLNFSYHELMDEIDDLLATLLSWPSAERVTFDETMARWTGLNVDQARIADFESCAELHRIRVGTQSGDYSREQWLDLLFSHIVQPRLGHERPVFVYDYPADQALLAKLKPGLPPRAARFELFTAGVELANGYEELDNSEIVIQRAQCEQKKRKQMAREPVILSESFSAAMASGLPPCSGVALGLDRLLMMAVKAEAIDEVISFTVEQA